MLFCFSLFFYVYLFGLGVVLLAIQVCPLLGGSGFTSGTVTYDYGAYSHVDLKDDGGSVIDWSDYGLGCSYGPAWVLPHLGLSFEGGGGILRMYCATHDVAHHGVVPTACDPGTVRMASALWANTPLISRGTGTVAQRRKPRRVARR